MSRLFAIAALLVLGGCRGMSTGSIRLSQGTVTAGDDVAIAYDVRGRRRIAIVFVHCWSCDRQFWREQVGGFADEYRDVTIDLPGHFAGDYPGRRCAYPGLICCCPAGA